MNRNPTFYNLTPAGYLIVQESVDERATNPHSQRLGPYFGVDRLPFFLHPDPKIRHSLKVSSVEGAPLRNAIEDWFDAQGDKNAFITNRDKAFRLLKNFKLLGLRLELIYCQFAWKSGEEGRLSAYAEVEGGFPVLSITYGFDVSWPTCKHSAIFQPGVVHNNPFWTKKLNGYGLLNEYSEAVKLREEYLAVYQYPPFDVYLVQKVC